MIAFGVSITDREVYERCALPGIQRAAEKDSVVLARPSAGTIFESYNALLDEAAALEGLEALVLLHQDTEIVDADFCQRLRRVLEADPAVGVVGCVGALDVRTIAWWEGSVRLAAFLHQYPEYGGGTVAGFSWERGDESPYSCDGEVESVDGFLLCLSPWVVRNIRFDPSLGSFHGYDFDFCLQVRASGKKVLAVGFRAIHHHSLDLVSDLEGWIEANVKVVRKWYGRMPRVGTGPGTWKERARRAEAERDLARAVGHANVLEGRAMLHDLERAIKSARESVGWRLTAPLRLPRSLAKRLTRRRRRPSPGNALEAEARPRGHRTEGKEVGRYRGIGGNGRAEPRTAPDSNGVSTQVEGAQGSTSEWAGQR